MYNIKYYIVQPKIRRHVDMDLCGRLCPTPHKGRLVSAVGTFSSTFSYHNTLQLLLVNLSRFVSVVNYHVRPISKADYTREVSS